MDHISCKVCLRVYCNKNCVPGILVCGHSLCLTCSVNLIRDKKHCPTCSAVLLTPLETYPINLDLLQISVNLQRECYPRSKNMLYLKDYENTQHFLCDLATRLYKTEKIFACEKIGRNGLMYAPVTLDKQFHIHSLSYSKPEDEASLVLFQDLRLCLPSIDKISPFIWFQDQKLYFTLTEDTRICTLHFIKLCTGENKQYLKGCHTNTEEFMLKSNGECSPDSLLPKNVNCCNIWISSDFSGCGYEKSFLKVVESNNVRKGEVIIQNFYNEIKFWKVTDDDDDNIKYYNVVGKLRHDCEIKLDQISFKLIQDCGISFALS